MRETILSVLPGQSDQQRVTISLRQIPVGQFAVRTSQMVMRHETWSEDVGWFAQSTIELTSGQVGELRSVLGAQAASIGSACRECISDRKVSSRSQDDWQAATIPMTAHRAG